jgi:CBS-domain-containing membrane protein
MTTMVRVANKFELNKSLFSDTTVGQLVFNQKDCVSISCDAHVDKALELMVMRGVSSLAVKDNAGNFTGILNISDIVAHMSGYVVGGTGDDPGQRHRHLEPRSSDKDALNFPCCHLLGLTWESRHLVVLDATDRIDAVLEKFSSGNHRALVQGKGWWQVISQWDLAVWLSRHCREVDDPNLASDRRQYLGNIVDAKLDELGLSEYKHVVSVANNVSAKEAFHGLAQNGVSAMPIVDVKGILCGTISSSDLRGMDSSKLKSLSLPVMDFLKVSNLYQSSQVVANKETKFGDLLLRIQARDVHRVWLVDHDYKPCGVVSLTDILHQLNQFLHELPATRGPYSEAAASISTQSSTLGVADKLGGGREVKMGGKSLHGEVAGSVGGGGEKSVSLAGDTCRFGNKACSCTNQCSCQAGNQQQPHITTARSSSSA